MSIKKFLVVSSVFIVVFIVSFPVLYSFLFRIIYDPQWRYLEILIPEEKIEILDSAHERYFLGSDEYSSNFIIKIDKANFDNFVDRLHRQEFFEVKSISNDELKFLKDNLKKNIAEEFNKNTTHFFTYGENSGYNYQFDIYASSDKSIIYISSYIWK